MNTRASVAYGWGVLIAAGGGAYFFAKRSINNDRAERAAADERRRQTMNRMQYGTPPPPKETGGHASPGKDAHEQDVAPAATREVPKGKYESAVAYRSPKGDRFS
ncbi:hypothetical protein BDZ85DRAFT_284258 [Elsinoe ampelina]|uniref:Uncharacterized protein n=1 Tax=Elsinoe ampelina TaxID=302913 RepID=A0A6A6G4I7_9PEZI|nr:hypothetical protein BDZ85DRAFT_284258 [Elsinoe ampelina]